MDARDVGIGEAGGLQPCDALGVRLARAERADVAAGRFERQVSASSSISSTCVSVTMAVNGSAASFARPSSGHPATICEGSKRAGLANAVLGSMTLTSYPDAVAIAARCCAMCVAPTIMTRRAGVMACRNVSPACIEGASSAPQGFGDFRLRRRRRLENLPVAVGEAGGDDDRRSLGDCSVHTLEESQIRFGIEARHVDADFSAARETRPPCGFVGDAEVQGFRAAGLDNVEAGCDDVRFDAAPGNGALKLIDTGNGHLAAGTDRRGAPSINDRRDGNGPAGFEPSPGGGARLR